MLNGISRHKFRICLSLFDLKKNILCKQHIVQSKQCAARCVLHLWWYFLQGGGTVLKQACQPFPLPWLQVSEREMKPFHFVVVNSLRLYKLRRGDVLAVFLENRPEYVGVLLGLSKVQNTVQYTKHIFKISKRIRISTGCPKKKFVLIFFKGNAYLCADFL